MKSYHKDIVYFLSYAKLPTSSAAGKLLDVVGIGLFINEKSGVVVDISCTLLTNEAKDFLKSIIMGFSMHDDDISELCEQLQYRYHGAAQKPICVALRSVYEKYMHWKSEQNHTV